MDVLLKPGASVREVARRVEELVSLGQPYKTAQRRTRDIMDGGSRGLRALVGRTGERDIDLLDRLPAGNPMLSGITRLSQKLGGVPDVRVEPPRDSDNAKKAAEARQNIILHMDDASALEMQLPQIARWMVGYGFGAWVLTERMTPDGLPFSHLEMRDPVEAFPGDWGVDQRPEDVAFVRQISLGKLLSMYPEHRVALTSSRGGGLSDSSMPVGDDSSSWSSSAWSQRSHGVTIAEYYNQDGCWWLVPERAILLEFRPNPLTSGPMFELPKRFSFNRLQGQYDHVVGLTAMMARLTVMQAQFIQDSVHTETNIFGEAPAGGYRKGRFSVNEMEPGTTVSKPVNQMPFQVFQAIDRLERQLRMTAGYSVTDDAQSPAAWATGAGIEELSSSMSNEVREYQMVLRRSLERIDHMRLEWEDKVYAGMERSVVGEYRGARYQTSYRPSRVIDGAYRTHRKYGFMAGWDEPRKLNGGLVLVGSEIISKQMMRENLDNVDTPLSEIEAQINAEKATTVVTDTLLQMAQSGDPRAIGAAIDLLPAGDMKNTLNRFFFPEPEAPEAELAPQPEAPQGAPPGLDELFANPEFLARSTQNGAAAGGVQVQGEL